MGDVADMMMDGTLCEGCGEFIDDDPPGYPRKCRDCKKDDKKDKPKPKRSRR